jgi:four helix bundle protein
LVIDQERAGGPDELAERLMGASVRIGVVVDALPDSRLGRHIAGQLVRCGTSFAPNYEEGRAAESRNDFIHKLRVSSKEIRETRWWLKLSIRSNLLPQQRLQELLTEVDELVRILSTSVATAIANKPARTSRHKSTGNDQ